MVIKADDFIQWLEKLFSVDFVVGIVVALTIVNLSRYFYNKLNNTSSKTDEIYKHCKDIKSKVCDILPSMSQTINELSHKLEKLSDNVNQLSTLVNVIDRNTSNPQSTTLLTQQLSELSKSINDLQTNIKVLETKIIEKLKKIEGADYDVS